MGLYSTVRFIRILTPILNAPKTQSLNGFSYCDERLKSPSVYLIHFKKYLLLISRLLKNRLRCRLWDIKLGSLLLSHQQKKLSSLLEKIFENLFNRITQFARISRNKFQIVKEKVKKILNKFTRISLKKKVCLVH